jgi:hypothetical protein
MAPALGVKLEIVGVGAIAVAPDVFEYPLKLPAKSVARTR